MVAVYVYVCVCVCVCVGVMAGYQHYFPVLHCGYGFLFNMPGYGQVCGGGGGGGVYVWVWEGG